LTKHRITWYIVTMEALTAIIERTNGGGHDPGTAVDYLADHRDLLINGKWTDGEPERGAVAYQEAAKRWVTWMTDAERQPIEDDIRDYFVSLNFTHTPAGKKWSAATVQHHRQAVKHRTLLMAKELGDARFTAALFGMFKNIDHDIPAPKREKTMGHRDQYLKRADMVELIAAANTKRQQLIIQALWITGARVSELCDMRYDSCRQCDDGVSFTVLGKGSKTRDLFIPQALFDDIRENFPGDEWLFTANDKRRKDGALIAQGGRFNADYISRMVKKVGKRIGKNISAHVMRHSIITYQLVSGRDIEAVRKFAGHSSISTTQIYAHSEISHKQIVAAMVWQDSEHYQARGED